MDSIIEMTRELAYELQKDQRFISTQLAQSAADEDNELQKMISDFNEKRTDLSNEMAKKEKDNEILKVLDTEIRDIYARMMKNSNMKAYQEAKTNLDELVRNMITIITFSAQGQDPNNLEESGCSGSCEGCAGCH